MKNRFNRLIERAVSALSAVVMVFGNTAPIASYAEDPVVYAHTINLFDIQLTGGAEYSSAFKDNSAKKDTDPIDGYVWTASNSNSGHKFIYTVDFSLSGQGIGDNETQLIKEGFVEIHIPAHILRLKGQNQAGGSGETKEYADVIELSVPKASDVSMIPQYDASGAPVVDEHGDIVYVYDTDYDFLYKEATDENGDPEIVIYNIKPISAGQVYEFPMAYKMLYNTWEYEDLGESDAAKASVVIDSWKKDSQTQDASDDKDEIRAKTREIPVHINTGAEIKSTEKAVKQKDITELLTADQLEALSYIKGHGLALGAERDDYLYMVWQIESKVSTVTQKYNYTVSDRPGVLAGTDAKDKTHSVQGEFVAMNVSNGDFQTPPADGDGYHSVTVNALTGDAPYSIVITRYAKTDTDEINDAPRNGSYKAINDARGQVTPADEKDKVTVRQDQAEFIYERKNPNIPPLIEGYTALKKGLTTSYELNNILEDDAPVTGLKYSTESKMYSYGNTIRDLTQKLHDSIFATVNENDLSVTSPLGEYTATVGETGYKKDGVSVPTNNEMTAEELLKIVSVELASSFYGQKDVTYSFTDKDISLLQPGNSANSLALSPDDYCFSGLGFTFTADKVSFDPDTMSFSGEPITDRSGYEPGSTIDLYVYIDGGDVPVLAAKYHPDTNLFSDVDASIVSAQSPSDIRFAEGSKVTGYQLTTSNRYFCVQLNTKPLVTINPTDSVKSFLNRYGQPGDLKQVNVQNTGCYEVKGHDNTLLFRKNVSNVDLVSQDKRTSSISKTARNENADAIIGKDGESYRTINDTLNRQYIVTWETKVQELYSGSIDGVAVENVPVEQQSGVFYDLLPLHSDLIDGSVNVYIDDSKTPLPPSSFRILPKEEDHAGSGQTLVTIEVYSPCSKNYRVTYATVHSHADIQDYGAMVNNTVAYQTGNANIGEGYPDNGGNHAVSKSAYMTGLDPENGKAKRFIYAEATENIVALIQTSSGIFKYVSSKSDPSQKQSATVHPGEDYTYHFRMKNAASTKARDIAILDSVENYRTVEGKRYNYGINRDREWNGKIKSFNLSAVENRMGGYAGDLHLFVYTGDEIVDFDNDVQYSDAVNRQNLLKSILGELPQDNAGYVEHDDWKEVNWKSPGDLSKVTAFIVYTGPNFTLPKGASISFAVTMTAPDSLKDKRDVDPASGKYLTPLKTYNNVYRSFTNMPVDPSDSTSTLEQYYYTHFDYTEVSYKVTGALEFAKADSKTGDKIGGVEFSLKGVSDYGSTYDEKLVSDRQGRVLFENLEKGTYTLTETASDDDHMIDNDQKKVTVLPDGHITIVRIDGKELEKENGIYKIENDPRPHTDIVFSKVDSVTGSGISGAKFTLKGTSDLNSAVDMTAYSMGGTVAFDSVEPGSYTLTEEYPAAGYAAPVTNTYAVTVTKTGNYSASFTIEGAANNTISNDPLAKTKLIKADSISKNALDGAVFTITAPSALNDRYEALKQAYAKREESGDFKWSFDGTNWTQTLTAGSIKGEFAVVQLIPGSGYTLSETTAPKGYAPIADKTFSVSGSIVEFDDSRALEYIVLNTATHEYDTASPENAEYIRVSDEPTFEDKKSIDKSWVGSVTVDQSDPKFPKVHLKNEKPEEKITVVTIDKAKLRGFFTSSGWTSYVSAFKKIDKDALQSQFPELLDSEGNFKLNPTTGDWTVRDCKDTSAEHSDETGNFYVWRKNNSSQGTDYYWYSDANIKYMPEDCSNLFDGLSNLGNDGSALDLSEFDFSNVSNVSNMFNNCRKITQITFPQGGNVAVDSCVNMFNNCRLLQSLDLSWLNTSKVTNLSNMFYDCQKLRYIITDPNKFVSNEGLTSVSRFLSRCGYLEGFGTLEDIQNHTINLSGFGNCPNLTDLYNFIGGCWSDNKYVPNDQNKYYLIKVIDLCNFNPSPNWADNNDDEWVFHRIQPEGGVIVYSGDWSSTKGGCKVYDTIFKIGNLSNVTKNASGTKNYASQLHPYDESTGEGYFTDPTLSPNYKPTNNAPQSAPRRLTANAPLRVSAAPDYSAAPNGFTPMSPASETKAVEADPNRKTEFVYEYITGEDGTLVSTGVYTVPQTIKLTIRVPVDETSVIEYYYTRQTTATWKNVKSGQSPDWKLEMNVNNADEEIYLWEEKFGTYTADTSDKEPKITTGNDGKALLVNTATDQDTGSLTLKKTMKDDIILDPEQTFTFNVTMKNPDDSAYTKAPFNAEGKASIELKADEEFTLSGLPVGTKYTVSETIDSAVSDLYETVTVQLPAGTITKDTADAAEIQNRIKTRDLQLSKQSLLYENKGTGTLDPLGLDEDPEWRDSEFSFTVMVSGLVPEYEYSYGTDKFTSDKSGTANVSVKLRQGEDITFTGLPATAVYTITEETLTDTSLAEYLQTNDADTEAGVTTGQKSVKDVSSVTFTNTKTLIHDKYVITVKKNWLDENGTVMPVADDGTIMKAGGSASEPTIPSFLNTYLGRALKYTVDGKTYFMNVEPKFKTVKLNKANKWQEEVSGLEKTKTVSTGDSNTAVYEYVYFLWEDCPTAYKPYENALNKVTEVINSDEYSFCREETVAGIAYTYSLQNQKVPTHSLEVNKTVTGNFGDKSENFNFVIRFSAPDGTPITGTGLRVTFNGARNRTITLENDGSFTFTLSHGEKIVFEGLPEASVYTLTEKQADDYSTTIKRTVSSAEDVTVDGKTISGKLDSDHAVLYTNTRTGTLPTGIDLGATAAAAAALTAALGIGYLKHRKKEENK